MGRWAGDTAATALLRLAHDRSGIERSAAAAALGMGSGAAANTVAGLVAAGLLAEEPVRPTGRRGRPTTRLVPHPDGPLVAAAAIGHDRWEVAAVALGGSRVAGRARSHDGSLERTAAAVRSALADLGRRHGDRLQALAVSLPGTVHGGRLVVAPGLGWSDVDLSRLRPPDLAGLPLVTGNDATLAGAAEHRRGAAAGRSSALHLHLDHGIGGVLIDAGRPVLGAAGTSGEFGHLPIGSPQRRCRCGAHGCWNTALDPAAAARALRRPAPAAADGIAFVAGVLADARRGDGPALRVAAALGGALGRGVAGLVNALDPEVVTVGGLGVELLDAGGPAVADAYRGGLMTLRATDPPPVLPARLGADGPLLGAADAAFDTVLTPEGLAAWERWRPGGGR